ncbi:C40 family peptidase [Ammoniphilus sp. CFH 90114]|uniref:C40 family peptidase n=1 Tax=Ammoniphilus sp. CFH 90114 TaxID=2493665 RepID=UPI00100EEEFB|nr:C40 family peptidase [Ammoniphilus sp. CFH 90114]RXT04803.1 peptidoglycan endopeptidase [Ammoniphilus sp. CFH 90114]
MKKRLAGFLLATLLIASSAYAEDHTVGSGDTLSGIAAQYGVSVEKLIEVNGLESDFLSVNQKLVIPTVEEQSSKAKKMVYINADKLNVREVESQDSNVVTVLERGTKAELLEINGKWSKVKVGEQIGYVASEYLSANQEDSSRALEMLLSRMKTLAVGLAGTPYRNGGTTPKGFDCSGFTSYVMGKMGVKLPRSSAQQFSAGTKVDRKNLRVGDLLFFDTMKKGRISHVGIYIGNNKMIHSATRKVEVSDLNWYFNHYKYYGAKRVLTVSQK